MASERSEPYNNLSRDRVVEEVKAICMTSFTVKEITRRIRKELAYKGELKFVVADDISPQARQIMSRKGVCIMACGKAILVEMSAPLETCTLYI
jgi:hypothetical protein